MVSGNRVNLLERYDYPKVEVGVQIVERWILARLSNRRFLSLAELNAAIGDLLAELNKRPFKKLPGCRHSAFVALERDELRELPPSRMPIARFRRARVNIEHHVELDACWRRPKTEPLLRVVPTQN